MNEAEDTCNITYVDFSVHTRNPRVSCCVAVKSLCLITTVTRPTDDVQLLRIILRAHCYAI